MYKKAFGGIPMNLQTFAEGGADEGNAGSEGTQGKGNEPEETKPSFDDLLKGEGMQAEFDRRVAKALETAKSKWDASKNEELSEAEKLAKMTKEEKAQYTMQKRIEALEAREKEVTAKELKAEAKNTLAENKIPVGLAEILDYSDADKCKASIEAVSKAFSEAVEEAVKARINGSDGLKDTRANNNNDLDPVMQKALKAISGR